MSNFVARDDIPWGGVFAFTRGQVVPAEVVKEHGWDDLVVGENTKEAREIKADVSGQPLSSFEATTTTSRAAAKSDSKEG